MNPANPHFIRRWLAAVLLFVLTTLSAGTASAATGDLVVVCYNSDGGDDFALLALVNIPGGTRYFITDSGWSTNSNTLVSEGSAPSTNRQIQFDVAAGGIPFGTVIRFNQTGANVALFNPALGTLTMVDRFSGAAPAATKLSFSSTGDQILIYQTAGNAVGGAITMISAFNGSNNTSGGVFTLTNGWQVGLVPQAGQTGATSESNLPAGLIAYDGTNAATATAFGLANFPVGGLTNQDNYRYNGSFALADKTSYLTAINNPANWLADDANAYDVTLVGPSGNPAPEINVQGNGANIADGNATPTAADHTLYGSTAVTGGTLARTYTIQNLGTANLNVSGITFTGANAADFSVSGITLPAVIAQSGSTTFTVTFDPTAAGVRTATVNVANDDSSENPYDFAIQGNGFVSVPPTGTAPPLRWLPTIQNTNAGTTRAVGSTNSGDVIAASRINSFSATDIRVTRHVAATGAVAWTRDIAGGTGDDITDMVVDPATGDAYISARATVSGNQNWFVHKVNGDGTFGWTYTFDGTAAGTDDCVDLARTSDGNVVAVGLTTSTGGNNFARAAKINAGTGAELNVFTSPTAGSQFNGVATDTLGNTYATGASGGDGLTVKLNSTLGVVWTQTFNGTAGLQDSFSNVVVDPNGDCIVGGTTRITDSPFNSDIIVLKYAAAAPGNEVWRRTISGAAVGVDTITNLVTDAAGDLYAAGAIRAFTSSDRDAYVSKITGTTGASAWITTKFGSAPDSNDRYQNVRVVGSAVYAVGDIENTNRDILVSRFNAATGAEVWSATFNGTGNGADDVLSTKHVMAVLGTDAIAIGGETFDVSTNVFGIVLKYAPILPPTVSDVARTTNEDVAVAFAAANFTPGSYSDPDGAPLATVRITSLPPNGVLRISGSTFTVPQDIAIANVGNLTYTPNANHNGGDNFAWNGSNGTQFATTAASVNITINAVNDKPSYTAANPPAVNEDAGAQSVVGFVSNFNPGATNESAQTVLAYTVSAVGTPGLFSAGPAVATNGTLTYTPAANANGTSTFTVRVQDNGGTALSGIDTSDPQTFTITVNAVNDKPTFTAANPPAVNEDAGAQTVSGWVTNFNPGPNETGQTVLAYLVSNVGNTGLFSAQPAVATNGNLTFTPAANASGTSTFQVRVQDSGGTAFSGIDTSDPQTFTITVNAVNDNPTAVTDSLVRYPSQPVRVKVSTLLSNDTDPENNTLSLTAVGSALPAGATVTQDGTWVYYTPPVGSTSAGSFNYTISDGNGGTANGLVNLAIIVDNSTAQNITKIETLGDGSKRLTFGGIPGRTYRVQSTDSLTPATWTDRATVAADAQGKFQFTDPPPLPGSRFYRSVSP